MSSSALDDEIASLERRILEECPKDRGWVPPLGRRVAFRSLPLSDRTLMGLEGKADGEGGGRRKKRKGRGGDAGGGNKHWGNAKKEVKRFTVMTDIQDACLPHALAGRDVLGAAKTGSGKTLAFLIPLLEKLYRLRYSPMDGPGGIILSPTRELAVQIFEVLRSVGSHHDLSAGLLVGGKKEFGLEQSRVGRTNVIVATPGRLLQHLEQTPDLDVTNVVTLVLDEADRILDMGFREQMVRILDYLPAGRRDGGERQTLLFSATQTRRVSDLAALSLDPRPVYVGVHDETVSATPEGLKQGYVVVPLQHKLDCVFSFLKSHLKCKTIVFFSSCSQVRYVWRVFCALQPGLPVMALHGKVKQETRTKLYFDFLRRPSAVLLATDVAARGLDFPGVDWVVQADCPEDAETYVHRVGRTARYNAGGRSLLMLLPTERDAVLENLGEGKIPIKKLGINPSKTVQVSRKASALVAADADLNALAKKAFKSYVRSVHLMPDKEAFRAAEMPLDEYAASLGLASTPSVRFLKKMGSRDDLRGKKNVNRKLERLKEQIRAEKLKKRMEKMGNARVVERGHAEKRKGGNDIDSDSEEEGEDLLIVKKRHEWGGKEKEDAANEEEPLPRVDLHEVSRSRHPKKIRIDGSTTGSNMKIVFGNGGEEVEAGAAEIKERSPVEELEGQKRDAISSANEEYMREVRERLERNRDLDRAEEKERVREKHKKRRIKEKGEKKEEEDEAVMVTLGSCSDDESANGSNASKKSTGTKEETSDQEQSDGDTDDDSSVSDDGDLEAQALAMIRQKS